MGNIEYRRYVELLPGGELAATGNLKAVLYIEFSAFSDRPGEELAHAFSRMEPMVARPAGVQGDPVAHGCDGDAQGVETAQGGGAAAARAAGLAQAGDFRGGQRRSRRASGRVCPGVQEDRRQAPDARGVLGPRQRGRAARAPDDRPARRGRSPSHAGDRRRGRRSGPRLRGDHVRGARGRARARAAAGAVLRARADGGVRRTEAALRPGGDPEPRQHRRGRGGGDDHGEPASGRREAGGRGGDEHVLRFDDQHGLVGAAEMCNGAGVCRKRSGGTMCPSYMATMDERHATRGRANALRLAITGQVSRDAGSGEPSWGDPETIKTLAWCLSCKACKSECPTNVDISRLKAEYTAQRYKQRGGAPLDALLTGHVRFLNRLGSLTPRTANWVNSLRPGAGAAGPGDEDGAGAHAAALRAVAVFMAAVAPQDARGAGGGAACGPVRRLLHGVQRAADRGGGGAGAREARGECRAAPQGGRGRLRRRVLRPPDDLGGDARGCDHDGGRDAGVAARRRGRPGGRGRPRVRAFLSLGVHGRLDATETALPAVACASNWRGRRCWWSSTWGA